MINHELGKYIRLLRHNKSWTQAQLALLAGVSERTIQRIEKKGSASAETLLALASAFDINVEQLTSLMSKSDNKEPRSLIPIPAKQKAWIGCLVMLPAVYFAISNILYYNLGIVFVGKFLIPLNSETTFLAIFNTISPLIFLGGLSIALILNLDALMSFNVKMKKGGILSAVHFKPSLANLMIVALSFITMLVFIIYVFVENFTIR